MNNKWNSNNNNNNQKINNQNKKQHKKKLMNYAGIHNYLYGLKQNISKKLNFKVY